MKRDYNNTYPSVTQALDCLRKPGLEFWFRQNTPDFIKAESEKGKAVGTVIHEAIQSHIEADEIKIETVYPDEVKNALQSFFLFRKENPDIKLKKAELQLTSEKYKYNGTLDCIATYRGEEILVDWKTGTCKEKETPPIYAEHHYQTSAYVHLYNEAMKKNISTAMIVTFAKDKVAYNKLLLISQFIDDNFQEVFLPALSIWRYQNQNKGKNGGNKWKSGI